jgi:hypothetical protein
MGIVLLAFVYVAYLFLIGIATLIIHTRNNTKSKKRIVDEFFRYVNMGRGRHPRFSEHVIMFFVLQLLFPFFAFFVSLIDYSIATFIVFIAYSYATERVKRHRHNGISIGYEYPHPSNMVEKTTTEGAKLSRAIYSGSKGTYDLQVRSQPNPHVMIIGESGSGKSTTQETLLIRSVEKYNIPFLIIDWNGTYAHLKTIANVWNVPNSLRINPLLLNGMSPERRSGLASETLQIALELTPLQTQRVRNIMEQLYENKKDPDAIDLYNAIENEMDRETYREMKLQMRYIMDKLSRALNVFGSESEAFWGSAGKMCNVVQLQNLTDSEKTIVTLSIIQRITEQFEGNRENGIRLNIALDDAYRAIADYDNRETPIARIVREGRKYGFALFISTQLLNDLPNSIATNTAVKFVHTYHDPYATERVHKMLNMTELEKDILFRMPRGSCFLFDSSAIQNGRPNPIFLEMDRIEGRELESLSERTERIEIAQMETEQRVRIQKSIRSKPHQAENPIAHPTMPDVSVYRFLISMRDSNGNAERCNRMLVSKGWVTSPTTIYGTRGKPSLMQRAAMQGYINGNEFTKKAKEILEPHIMVVRQGTNAGGQVHKELMEKTVEMIQSRGNYAFVPEERDSFDVGEVEAIKDRKSLWDTRKLTVYEIQTDAEPSHIKKCIKKAKRYNAKLVIVTNSEKVKESVEMQSRGRAECIVIR